MGGAREEEGQCACRPAQRYGHSRSFQACLIKEQTPECLLVASSKGCLRLEAPSGSFQRSFEAPGSFQRSFEAPVSFRRSFEAPVSFQRSFEAPVSFRRWFEAPVSFQRSFEDTLFPEVMLLVVGTFSLMVFTSRTVITSEELKLRRGVQNQDD